MLLIAIAIYALLCLCGCVFQRKLIYFPTRLTPVAAEQTAVQEGFIPWRNPSGKIVGWKMPASATAIGSVLIVHGNAGCALDRGYIAQPIHDAAALDVYVLEYPGYGARDGSPSMKSILAAANDAFDQLPKTMPIYIVSESIGAGAAAYVAKTHPDKVGGMMMFVPYNNLVSVAQSKIPFLLPYLFLADRFNPAEWLADYRGPVKIALAEQDEIIPVKFGKKLFDGYNGPKQLQIFPGAHHNDIAEQPPEWWKDALAFWMQHAPAGQ